MTGVGRRQFVQGAAVAAAGVAASPVVPAAAAAASTSPAVTVARGAARFADLVSGMNSRWVADPDHVVLARSPEHVVAAVRQAVRSGARLSVRSGGHCYEDFVHNPEVDVVIDLAGMNRISWDPGRRAVAVEPGASLLEVYEALYTTWGVTIPGGTTGSVGMGGQVPGGGYGMLARRDGLVVDHLDAVEVVVVDGAGSVRTVVGSRDERDPNHDLWWGFTGAGGGNFGVVTKFWFRTPGSTSQTPSGVLPVPPASVLLSQIGIPWSTLDETRFARLLKNFGSFFERHQQPGTPYGDMFSFLVLNHRSAGGIGIVTQFDAGVPDARNLLSGFLGEVIEGVAGPEFLTPAGELPWLKATRLVASSGIVTDPTLRAEHKSAYLRTAVPEDQIAAIHRHLTAPGYDNKNAMAVVYSYGSKVNDVATTATAVPQRGSVLKLLYQAFWHDPAQDAANIGWLRDFYRDVYSASGGVPAPGPVNDGCYVNYPDADLSDPALNTSGVAWHDLYFQGNYPRLQRIKARWDPRDVFHHRQSVRLPS